MQLWGLENKLVHSQRRPDQLLQIQRANTGGGGAGAARNPNDEYNIDRIPVSHDRLDNAPRPTQGAVTRPVVITYVAQRDQAVRDRLMPNPTEIGQNHPLFRRARSYVVNIEDTDRDGTIGNTAEERAQLGKIVRGEDDQHRIPHADLLAHIDDNPNISQYNAQGQVMNENYTVTAGQEAADRRVADTNNPTDPEIDILSNNRGDSAAMEAKWRRITAELARILQALQDGGDPEELLPHLAQILGIQANAMSSKLAAQVIRRVHQLRQQQVQDQKALSRLQGQHTTDAAATARANGSMTEINARLRTVTDGIEESMRTLQTALTSREGMASFAQDVHRHRQSMIQRS